MKFSVKTLLAISLAGAGIMTAAAANSIKPGQRWNDTGGSHINAHGCCVVYHEGTYYWFGEDRTGSTSNGVSCYTSTDLYNWKRKGLVFKTSRAFDPETGKAILERPKVIFNPNTNEWVMYSHWENGLGYGRAEVCVAQCATIDGDYEYVDQFRPNEHDSRDQTIFRDSDGKAYHVCATDMNSNINVALLTDDYLAPAGKDYETKVLNGLRLEAPAMIVKDDTYYCLFSECDGWNPTPGHRSITTELMGYWEDCGNFCVDAGDATTYKSQSTFVLKVEGKEGAYIYMGDRWVSSDVGGKSEYVWLPLSIRSGLPTVRWLDEWDMSVFDTSDRFHRIDAMADGRVVRLLDKRSNRWISKSKNGFDIQDDNDSKNISFRLEATDHPYVWRLANPETGLYLDANMGIMQWLESSSDDSQLWHFTLEEDGCYKIQNVSDNKCISVSGSSLYAGSNIFTTKEGSSKSQSFGVYFDADAYDYGRAQMYKREYRDQVSELMAEQEKYEASQVGISSAGKSTVEIAAEGSEAVVTLPEAMQVAVTGIDGCRVYSGVLGEGCSRIALSKGVYVVAAGSTVVKIAIK